MTQINVDKRIYIGHMSAHVLHRCSFAAVVFASSKQIVSNIVTLFKFIAARDAIDLSIII